MELNPLYETIITDLLENQYVILERNWRFHKAEIDIIAKKIKVVQEVAKGLGLKNVKAEQKRAELVKEEFDFIVSRAVTNMPDFVKWTKDKTKKNSIHELKNGILYLKGGDLTEELQKYTSATVYDLPDYFDEDFFNEQVDDRDLFGYFQTEKYFKHIEKDIRKDFIFKDENNMEIELLNISKH